MYSLSDLQKLAGPFPPERLLELDDYLMQCGESYAPRPGLAWNQFDGEPEPNRRILRSIVVNKKVFLVEPVWPLTLDSQTLDSQTLDSQTLDSQTLEPDLIIFCRTRRRAERFECQRERTECQRERTECQRERTECQRVEVYLPHEADRAAERLARSNRYVILVDEAQRVYPLIRRSIRPFVRCDEPSLLGLLLLAEEMDESKFPECAGARRIIPGENDPMFRSVRSLVTLPSAPPAEFVLQALADDHFTNRRTILVACDLRRSEIEALKLKMHVVILGRTVSLLRPGKPEIKVRATGPTSELLFRMYKRYRLSSAPLIVFGSGAGSFHYVSDECLIWSDLILGQVGGRIEAERKTRRMSGVIGHCPEYAGMICWTTPESLPFLEK
jgi:hypothetical protein